MKKLLTLLFTFIALYTQAQQGGPVVKGTYLPVRGTSVLEIWDITTTNIPVPVADTGAGVSWDYSGKFANATQPYKLSITEPGITPYSSYFPVATHSSFLTAPFDDITDSLFSYYFVDTNGLYMIGGRSLKSVPPTPTGPTPVLYAGNNDTITISPKELYAPSMFRYGNHINNKSVSRTTGGILSSISPPIIVNLESTKIKDFHGMGYGTLTMPDGHIYYDVLLTKIIVTSTDSAYNPSNGAFIFQPPYSPSTETYVEYFFTRNNTFASTVLMYLKANDEADTVALHGWYTLPVDFGFISGNVYTDTTKTTPVTIGKALLYRANSNFTAHDILDTTSLDGNGFYKFDSIPYGEYRVAIRTDTLDYPKALTTYFGDTTDWVAADTIITFNDSTSDGHDIHLQYYPNTLGSNQIKGLLRHNSNKRSNQPIPGIDVVVQKKPAGNAFREPRTDSSGVFEVSYLPDGEYRLFVDVPGCLHATTYDFCVYGGQILDTLDFELGTDSLHTLNTLDTTALCNPIITSLPTNESPDGLLQVFPNPYSTFTIVKLSLTQTSDITLEVFNVLGEKVQVLCSGAKQAGNYSYDYSASAIHRPAGVYFIRLMANGKTSVLKVIEQ